MRRPEKNMVECKFCNTPIIIEDGMSGRPQVCKGCGVDFVIDHREKFEFLFYCPSCRSCYEDFYHTCPHCGSEMTKNRKSV